jgi:ABC-2 type transport system ATP-binding protein
MGDGPAPGRPAIAVESLVKTYGTRRAVDGVSFEVGEGEVFALLGPNGAGKTTTVEILEGYRRADGGRARVLGMDPGTSGSKLKARIGVMLQDPGLYLAITPREALDLFARFYPDPRPTDELLTLVGLGDAARTRYRRLSGGEKKRLALALALVGRPQVLFLDEPTAGLDPQARRTTWEIISSLEREGVAILLTTHYLEEAERLAKRIGIMDRGKLLVLGTPGELLHGEATRVHLRITSPVDPSFLLQLPSVSGVRQDGLDYVLETTAASLLLMEVTKAMHDAGRGIQEIRVGQGLEDLFLELTAGERAV